MGSCKYLVTFNGPRPLYEEVVWLYGRGYLQCTILRGKLMHAGSGLISITSTSLTSATKQASRTSDQYFLRYFHSVSHLRSPPLFLGANCD